MKHLLYPGTFDPVTRGHEWMIAEALKLAEKVTVAVGRHPTKTPHLTVNERVSLLQKLKETTFAHVGDRLQIASFEAVYVADFAQTIKADVLLRGMRTADDFAHEQTLQRMNANIRPDLQTVYLLPPRDLAEVSSSTVRSLVGYDRWEAIVSTYLPKNIEQDIIAHLK